MSDAKLLAVLPVAIVQRTAETLRLNPMAEAIVGHPAHALATIDAWFSKLFGTRAAEERAAYEIHRTSGFAGTRTVCLGRPDNTLAFVDFTGQMTDDGELWVLHDVTDRHLKAERFGILFERSTNAHLLFDHSGIIDCNSAAVQMLLCRDKAQLLETHPAMFSPEWQPDGSRSADKSVEMDTLAQQNGFHRFDWMHRKMDGTDFPVEVTLNPVTLASGPALLVAWHDVTERVAAEHALREARDKAVEATRSKSAFLANMSHELRTPLNAIIGYSELLAEDALDMGQDAATDLDKVSEAGRHLLALINDILDLAKIEAGHITLHNEWIDVATMGDALMATIRPVANKNENALSLEVDPAVGPMFGDALRIRQMLLNLMGNACKFTQGGAIGLKVSPLVRDGKDWVSFDVWDTGIGIAPDALERVFGEFEQEDDSTTREYGGTGLGLAITGRLCEQMQGELKASSVLGEGSSFRVMLPLHALDVPIATPLGETGSNRLPDDAPLVVVIDDDVNARELIRRTLTRGGFRTAMAPDGRAGMALCRRLQPDAITLDVLMPEHDGWEVLAALKAEPELESIPVVVVSMLADRAKGFALGARDCLTKPIQREQLLAALGDIPGRAAE